MASFGFENELNGMLKRSCFLRVRYRNWLRLVYRDSFQPSVKHESAAPRLDSPYMRSAEVCGDQQLIALRRLVQQFASRNSSLRAILAERAIQIGLGHLDRVMNHVAQKDARIFTPRSADGNVPRRMSRCWKDRKEFMNSLFTRRLTRDEFRLTALNHRKNAVFKKIEKWRRLLRAILRRKARVLLARKNVAGVRERRHPPPVFEPCIPTGMVHMKVRAQHDIHVLWRTVRGTEAIQIWIVQTMPEFKIGPFLIVAEAGVNQDRSLAVTDYEGLKYARKAMRFEIEIGR